MMKTQGRLSAIGDEGTPVDWWFMYKIAGSSVVSDGSKASGTEYVYYDSSFEEGEKLRLSPHKISDQESGAVANTLNQIYHNLQAPNLGWFFYNDENPLTGEVNGSRGHTKGVLAFDLETDSAFWLIHSAPKFPLKDTYSYPFTAMPNAQSLLCISLKDAETAKAIAGQMYVAHQPNVYLASAIPESLTDESDPRALLIQDKVTPETKAYANFITFESFGGETFRCIAKNKYWNTKGDDDFYNDLVGIVLQESLEVETWEHGAEPPVIEADKLHSVTAMKEVDLSSLEINPSYKWAEAHDHAKIAISAENEEIKYVCVGGINFTIAQEKRSGGTVSFICPGLWQNLFDILKK